MSNQARQWGRIHISLKRGGFMQLKIACITANFRRFFACRNGTNNDFLFSSFAAIIRLRFLLVFNHTTALVTSDILKNDTTIGYAADN
jgi:hypothetical protein